MPTVVGKAASPRCFKGLKDKKNSLGVPYYSNAKAWMNSDVMLDDLTKNNQNLLKQKRSVVFFLDNVTSHPTEPSKKFSHIRVIFLPKNTTSCLQALNAGTCVSSKTTQCSIKRFLLHINFDANSISRLPLYNTYVVCWVPRIQVYRFHCSKFAAVFQCGPSTYQTFIFTAAEGLVVQIYIHYSSIISTTQNNSRGDPQCQANLN